MTRRCFLLILFVLIAIPVLPSDVTVIAVGTQGPVGAQGPAGPAGPAWAGGTITSPILGPAYDNCATPPYSFTGDTTTGLCLSADGVVHLRSNGENVFTVSGSAITGTQPFQINSATGSYALCDGAGANCVLLTRDAAETFALRNGGTTAAPVNEALKIYNVCEGTNCETKYNRVNMGWLSLVLFGITQQYSGAGTYAASLSITGWDNVQLPTTFITGAAVYPPTGTTTLLGDDTKRWTPYFSNAYVKTSIQDSNFKALTDNVATQFVSVAIPQTAGSNYAGIEISYTIFCKDATNFAVEHGRVDLSCVNAAGTESCTVGPTGAGEPTVNVIKGDGTASFVAPIFTATAGADLVDVKVQSDCTGVTPTTHMIQYLPKMEQINTVTPGT